MCGHQDPPLRARAVSRALLNVCGAPAVRQDPRSAIASSCACRAPLSTVANLGLLLEACSRRSHDGLPRQPVDMAPRRWRGRNGASVTIINAAGSEDGMPLPALAAASLIRKDYERSRGICGASGDRMLERVVQDIRHADERCFAGPVLPLRPF